MTRSRPLEDHSPQVRRFREAYGGSDRAASFFRTPEYVKYNSLSKARDLGRFTELRTQTSNTVGGITGTNTRFYKVTLAEEARFGARLVGAPQCAIDWICLHVINAHLDRLPMDPSGYVNTEELVPTRPTETRTSTSTERETITVVSIARYCPPGYFEAGYTFELSTIITEDGSQITTDLTDFALELAQTQQLGADTLDSFALESYKASILPAGTYYILVTTERWHETPYDLQIIIAPRARDLEGNLSFTLSPSLDTGVKQLSAELSATFAPYGRFQEHIALSGDASLSFMPVLGLAVITPLG